MTAQPRQLVLQGLHNIRDLGGLRRQDGSETARGRVYRSCAMSELPPKSRGVLAERGFVRIIDLRSDRERQDAPTYLATLPGIADHHIPLFADLAPVYKALNSSRGFSMEERYLAALDESKPRFAEVFRALAAGPREGATLFHCTAGKDRTGLVAAMLLTLAGVEREEILKDYTMTTTEARDFIARLGRKSRMHKTPPGVLAKMLAAPVEAMEAVLNDLDQTYGGAASYLESAGLTPSEIEGAAALLRA